MLAVAIQAASFGAIEVQTATGARCAAKVVLPSGGYLIAGEFVITKEADGSGLVHWSYPPSALEHGPSVAVVSCVLGEQTAEDQARFVIP